MPVIPDDPFGGIKGDSGDDSASPRAVARFHTKSDVDSSVFASHHTLGTQHQQASFGDHTHDGKNSFAITIPSAAAIVFGTEIGQTQIVRKAGNTDRQSAGALAADPELVVPVLVSGGYIFDALIMYSYGGVGASAFDFSYDFNIPSGTMIWDDNRVDPAVATGTLAQRGFRDQGNSGNPASGVITTTAAAHDARAIIRPAGSFDIGATPGNFAFRWAQSVSTAVNLRVAQRSFLRVTRVA